MAFDFDAAVTVPLRMQPGLRRLAAGTPQFTPVTPGSRHQREKLAVLSAFADGALCAVDGFDAGPAVAALAAEAARQRPEAWTWDGHRAEALLAGTAVDVDGRIEQTRPGVFGLGDEVARCLRGLPPAWRLPALASLSFAEDVAVVDAATGTLPWLAVCLPSHWAPRRKVGLSFAQAHAPVADSEQLLKAADALVAVATGPQRWERFVWNVTPHPRLHAHPDRVDDEAWRYTPVGSAWWRTEHQSFVPVGGAGGMRQALFLIRVQVEPLAAALAVPGRARRLHDALAGASPAVIAYRELDGVRDALLAHLAARAAQDDAGAA